MRRLVLSSVFFSWFAACAIDGSDAMVSVTPTETGGKADSRDGTPHDTSTMAEVRTEFVERPYVFHGYGAFDCGVLLEEHAEDPMAMEDGLRIWLAGYLSAQNFSAWHTTMGGNITNGGTASDVLVKLLSECTAQPERKVGEVAVESAVHVGSERANPN